MDRILDQTGKTCSTKLLVHPFLPILFSCGLDLKIYAWDLETKALLFTLEKLRDFIPDLAFDPTGKYLISASNDASIHYWDLENPSRNITLGRHFNHVTSVIWDYSGKYFASGSYDTTIRIWDATTLDWLLLHEHHTKKVTCLTSHPTLPLFASGSEDGTVIVWNWRPGFHLCKLKLPGKTSIRQLQSNEKYIVALTEGHLRTDGPGFSTGKDIEKIYLWRWPKSSTEKPEHFKIIPLKSSSRGIILKENKLVYWLENQLLIVLDISNDNPDEWETLVTKRISYDEYGHLNLFMDFIPKSEESKMKLVLGGYTNNHPIHIIDLE